MLVTLLPLIANILDVRRGGVFQSVREDLVQRSLLPAADAKKAEGASWVALRIPKPPALTGRVACIQVEWSSMLTFKILARIDRSSWSKEANSGEMQHGAVLSV